MALMKLFNGTSDLFVDIPIKDGSDYILTDTGQQFLDIGDQRIQLCDQNMDQQMLLKIAEMKALLQQDSTVKAVYLSYMEHPTVDKAIVVDTEALYNQISRLLVIDDLNYYSDDE